MRVEDALSSRFKCAKCGNQAAEVRKLAMTGAFAKFITMQSFSNVMSEGMQRTICIEKYEDTIYVRFPYDPDYIATYVGILTMGIW